MLRLVRGLPNGQMNRYLLIVALELLGLVVARWVTLPRAMEKAVRSSLGGFVQVVVPGSLAVAAVAHGGRKGHTIRKESGVQILSLQLASEVDAVGLVSISADNEHRG